jgi:NCS2 family nucleobase:cation symporter-2
MIAIAFALLSMVPAAAALITTIPAPVVGGALFFTAAFVFTSGLQAITARLLDSRKIIVIGFSFAMAMIADTSQDLLVRAPALLHPILGNALVLGTVSAVLLNLIMRIGVRQRVTMKLDAGHVNRDTIERFLTEQGGRSGATSSAGPSSASCRCSRSSATYRKRPKSKRASTSSTSMSG